MDRLICRWNFYQSWSRVVRNIEQQPTTTPSSSGHLPALIGWNFNQTYQDQRCLAWLITVNEHIATTGTGCTRSYAQFCFRFVVSSNSDMIWHDWYDPQLDVSISNWRLEYFDIVSGIHTRGFIVIMAAGASVFRNSLPLVALRCSASHYLGYSTMLTSFWRISTVVKPV